MAQRPIDARHEAMQAMIPKSGFNLVGLDDFERDPADELFLIGHFDTQEEAEAARADRLKSSPGLKMYVYGPES